MPRNRYVRFVHAIEQQQRLRQEKDLATLASELRSGAATPTIRPLVTSRKERRCARLAQKRLLAARRPGLAADVTPQSSGAELVPDVLAVELNTSETKIR
jgi:hypothetical protein